MEVDREYLETQVDKMIGAMPEEDQKSIQALMIAIKGLKEGISTYNKVKSEKSGRLCGCGSFHESVDTAKRLNSMNTEDCELWKVAVSARAAVEAILGYDDPRGRQVAMNFALGLIFTEVVEQSAKEYKVQ